MTINSYMQVNRESFLSELSSQIKSHNEENTNFALLLININNFRNLNTLFGYRECDTILAEFLNRLSLSIRKQDLIYRIGNSDIALIIPDIVNKGLASLAALKIKESVSEPYTIGENLHCLHINIGITFFPDHADNTQQLLQHAETALQRSRQEPEAYLVYTEIPDETGISSWNLESDLRNAQDNDEFELFFQPQVSIQTGMIYGAEALIRWKSENKGYIRPDIFIPIAEKNGQIHSITWWTINSALRMISNWPTKTVPLKIAINLSTKVLSDPDFIDSVTSAINIWNTDHHRLIFEITESALMEDITTSFSTLHKLKDLGFCISIDDFGTGYSSMAYFKNIPANELKIDKSFILNIQSNDMDKHIVKTVINMAHGFGLNVVAEGIEDIETYEALKALDCDIAQGYYLAKPMPLHEFTDWVNNHIKKFS